MPDSWRRIEVTLTGIIAVFTVVLGVVSYFQYDAARKAARRAMQANQIAKEAIAQSEKAFLYVSNVGIYPTSVPVQLVQTASADVLLSIANSGNTPARAAFPTANLTSNAPENFDYPDYSAPVRNAIFIAPKESYNLRLPLSYMNALAVREGHVTLKVYGHIEYKDDVLHQNHRTWFCFNYVAHQVAPNVLSGQDVFEECAEHNCADNDCKAAWNFRPRITAPSIVTFPVDIPTLPITQSTPIPKKRPHTP